MKAKAMQERREVRGYVMKNMEEMERLGQRLGLPSDVMDEARRLYLEVYSRDVNRGYTRRDVQSAVLYTACREAGLPMLLSTLVMKTGSDKLETGRAFLKIRKVFNIKIKPITPEALLPYLCDELGVEKSLRERALSVMHSERARRLWRNCLPNVVASCSLYVASKLQGEELPMPEIASVSGVTVETMSAKSSAYLREEELAMISIESETEKREGER